jgi:hypothetical protein
MTGLELMSELRSVVGPGDNIEAYMENKLSEIIDIIQAGNCPEPIVKWLNEIKSDAAEDDPCDPSLQ